MDTRAVSEAPSTYERSAVRSASIGKYRILAELGEGGMANVYLAVAQGPSGFSKLVVLKALRSNLAHDEEFIQMFLDEARLAARLNHPNVVQTYEVGREGDRYVIVMEYLEGQPLSRVRSASVQAGGLPLAMHVRILADTLAGLHHAHELKSFEGETLGLVHRDVSPQNVFVTYDGQVKVLDFGVAKAANSSIETRTGQLKGKIQYMSPEQMAGGHVDRRADLFAVGVMLWEAAAGKRMWKAQPDITVMNRVVNGQMPPIREERPDIDEALAQVIDRALAHRPDDRFATAAEMEAALHVLLDRLPDRSGNRDVARFVASVFDEPRKKLAATIDDQMHRLTERGTSGYSIVNVAEPGALISDGGQTPSTQRSGERPVVEGTLPSASGGGAKPASAVAVQEKRGARPLVAALLVLILVGAAGAVLAMRARGHEAGAPAHGETAVATAPTSAATTSASAATAAPETIELRVAVTPDGARVSLDNQPLEGNPAVVTRPKDDQKHTLRAAAPGYAPKEVVVTFDSDANVSLGLDRIAAPSRAAPAPRAPAPRRSAPAAPAADGAKKPSCEQPFYVDDRGIMTMRPECR